MIVILFARRVLLQWWTQGLYWWYANIIHFVKYCQPSHMDIFPTYTSKPNALLNISSCSWRLYMCHQHHDQRGTALAYPMIHFDMQQASLNILSQTVMDINFSFEFGIALRLLFPILCLILNGSRIIMMTIIFFWVVKDTGRYLILKLWKIHLLWAAPRYFPDKWSWSLTLYF